MKLYTVNDLFKRSPNNIKVINNNEDLKHLADFFSRKKEFCWDLETNVVKGFFYRRIRTISFGDHEEQYVIDLLPFTNGKDLSKTQGNYKADQCYSQLISLLTPVLDSKDYLKIVYNGLFEYVTTRWCLGIYSWNFFDCYIAEQLLNAGKVHYKMSGFWALDDVVARYLKLQIDKTQQKTFTLTDPLTEEQITYAALDVRLPKKIKQYQEEKIKAYKSELAAEIEFNCIPATGEQHLTGLLIDRQEWEKRIIEINEQHKKYLEELDAIFYPVVGPKVVPEVDLQKLELEWKACKTKERPEKLEAFRAARRAVRTAEKLIKESEGKALINYESNMQLKNALVKLGIPADKLPNTSEQTLTRLREYPVTGIIKKFRSNAKLRNNYGENIYEYIDKNTGRIHSDFSQIGAATGRPASRNMNVYNLPKEDRWRRGFVARPGYKLITSDFSGQELRIVAEISQEPVLINAFRNNWDVHSYVGEMIFQEEWKFYATPDCNYYNNNKQKCKCIGHTTPFHEGTNHEAPSLRTRVKSINFGIIYGMSEYRLADELEIDLEEAKDLLDRYKERLPVLMNYIESKIEIIYNRLYNRTLAGRIRQFKEPTFKYAEALVKKNFKQNKIDREPTEREIKSKLWSLKSALGREGFNHEVQGLGTDMLKLAMGCGYDRYGVPYLWHILREQGGYFQNNVYDEILIEAPENKAQDIADVIKERMIAAASTFVRSIPFDVEQHIDNCWKK